MNRQKIGQLLFWVGVILALTFSGIIGRGLYHNLRTLTAEELAASIWAMDKPLFMLWAFSVTLGSILAGVGAFFIPTGAGTLDSVQRRCATIRAAANANASV